MDSVDTSIILCAYNEGHVIAKAIRRVEAAMEGYGARYEVIVVDDGSTDDTRERALEYKKKNNDSRLKVLGYDKNRGKGGAIKYGFAHSAGKKIVFIDGDLGVSPKHIPEFLEKLEKSDVVIGSKWHPGSSINAGLKRKFLSIGFNTFSRMMTGIKMRDTQTGLKAFRRDVLEHIAPKLVVNKYAFDLELMVMCNHGGFRIAEMPVKVTIDGMARFKDIFRMALDTLRVAYRIRVLKVHER
ncbi:MAG: glycosyltransferase [Candidatus Verstraetearchaeota archaeon]|nr:glycosyltransferase [Candidatus Verstraetearchaeota archaeon]